MFYPGPDCQHGKIPLWVMGRIWGDGLLYHLPMCVIKHINWLAPTSYLCLCLCLHIRSFAITCTCTCSFVFSDAQASLAPTHVSLSVGPLVILLNFHSINVLGCSTWKVKERWPQLFLDAQAFLAPTHVQRWIFFVIPSHPWRDYFLLLVQKCLNWGVSCKNIQIWVFRAEIFVRYRSALHSQKSV